MSATHYKDNFADRMSLAHAIGVEVNEYYLRFEKHDGASVTYCMEILNEMKIQNETIYK